jgi:hypothetical protein
MKYTETNIIYNKIASTSKLTPDQLTTIGVTMDKIDKAMHQCVSSGMSRKKAMITIYKMWNYAEPEDETK